MARIYYGWYVVAALFVMLTVASGLAFYNLSVYMNALVVAYGFPVGAVSSATALFFVSSGFAGLLAGRLIQRFDPRWTIALGGVLGAGALLALGRVTELWQLYLVYALFGAGHACASLVPATTLVTRWFDRQRSIALSVASTGLSIGGVLLTPASAALIGNLGLEMAMPRLALLWFLGIVPVTMLVVRGRPGTTTGSGGAAAVASGWAYADAIRSRFFALVTAAWVLAMLAQVGGIAHLFNLAATRVDATVGRLPPRRRAVPPAWRECTVGAGGGRDPGDGRAFPRTPSHPGSANCLAPLAHEATPQSTHPLPAAEVPPRRRPVDRRLGEDPRREFPRVHEPVETVLGDSFLPVFQGTQRAGPEAGR